MKPLAVIAGVGGINAAGRSSAHHWYRRSVIDAHDPASATDTLRSLAALMGVRGQIDAAARRYILEHTLVRGLEPDLLDPGNVPWNCRARLAPGHGTVSFIVAERDLPGRLPEGWKVSDDVAGRVRIEVSDAAAVLLPVTRALEVSAAGQLPTGFDPKALYAARGHPRAVQIALFAANDALGSLGIDWQTLLRHVPPDRVSVYAGSALGAARPRWQWMMPAEDRHEVLRRRGGESVQLESLAEQDEPRHDLAQQPQAGVFLSGQPWLRRPESRARILEPQPLDAEHFHARHDAPIPVHPQLHEQFRLLAVTVPADRLAQPGIERDLDGGVREPEGAHAIENANLLELLDRIKDVQFNLP